MSITVQKNDFCIINTSKFTLATMTIISDTISKHGNILTASIHYGNINQTLKYISLVNPLNVLYETSTFRYNVFELVFLKGTPYMINRVMSMDVFSLVNPVKIYTDSNKQYCHTVGEYYIQTVLSRIFNGIELTRDNIGLWLKIFSGLISRGFMTPRIFRKTRDYINGHKMSRLLRVVILIVILNERKRRLKIVSDIFIKGIDQIIGDYCV